MRLGVLTVPSRFLMTRSQSSRVLIVTKAKPLLLPVVRSYST
jgi:hypothetical protein